MTTRGPNFRLVIDASAAFNQGAGIGRYARCVVAAAIPWLTAPEVTLWYAPARPGPPPFAEAALAAWPATVRPRVRRGPLSRRRSDQLWFRLWAPLPLQLFAGRADVVYSPDFTVPPALSTPRVPTVHDLAYLICPERAPAPLREYLMRVVPRLVGRAARVVAVSETTRIDLIERLGVAPERIVVVPNGVDERFLTARPLTAEQRDALGIPSAYLLTVGTLEPRKNHLTLFEAMRRLRGRVDLPLVVAGRLGWNVGPILAAAEPLMRGGRVMLVKYVPESLLPGLYAGAAAVVYPSWYEGFGLPVLEALATGTPVVASTAPALREVAGSAADYVAAADADGLAAAIERALDSERQGEEWRERRRSRARQFRWEDAGARLARLLVEVAGGDDRWLTSGRTA